jgi:hypothetical protein
MSMTAALRRFTLTTHVTSSVGWLGAVLTFIALAAIGLTSGDERVVRGSYLLMAPAAWFVLVPLAHASLLSGLVLALGTAWGLFRHYWVALKLAITAFATAILLVYMGTFREMAGVAADPVAELGLVRNPSPLVHGVLALVLLLTATVLSIYKPFGMTPYGNGHQAVARAGASRPAPAAAVPRASGPRGLYVLAAIGLAGLLAFVLAHLVGGHALHH